MERVEHNTNIGNNVINEDGIEEILNCYGVDYDNFMLAGILRL